MLSLIILTKVASDKLDVLLKDWGLGIGDTGTGGRKFNQQSTINNQQSTINNQQSTINNQQSTIKSKIVTSNLRYY